MRAAFAHGRVPVGTVAPISSCPTRRRSPSDGTLVIGGCRVDDWLRSTARPCSSTTRRHIRARCREAVDAFGAERVVYATKAFLCRAMARLAHEEGMLLDVASGGELHVALAAGVPASACTLHGNNKSVDELRTAIEAGVRHIVVDSFDELDRLDALHADGAGPAGRAAAGHPGRARPHPRVHRHRPGRLQVRLQPGQRRRRRGRRTGPPLVVGPTSSGCTATSAPTSSPPRASGGRRR